MTMRGINRVLASLLGATLLMAGIGIALGALFIPGPYVITFSAGEQWNVSHLTRTDQIVAWIIGLPIALTGLTICVAEVIGPPRHARIVIRDEHGHLIHIGVQEAERRLEACLEELSDVQTAAVKLSVESKRASIQQILTVHPGTRVPLITTSVHKAVEDVLAQQLGLRPGEIQTDVRFGEPSEPST